MDSLEFYRSVVLADLDDRDRADDLLRRAIAWIAENSTPEKMFSQDRLVYWANKNGYTNIQDVSDLVKILRQVQPIVVARTDLASAITNAIYQYG